MLAKQARQPKGDGGAAMDQPRASAAERCPGDQRLASVATAMDTSPRLAAQAAQAAELAASPRLVTQAVLGGRLDDRRTLSPYERDGTGLPGRLRQAVEVLSGVSLAGVRVHHGSPLPGTIQARAFAHGNEIHVGPGHGRHLAHEAWHIVQQRQGRVAPTLQAAGLALNNSPQLEGEAERMGARAESLARSPHLSGLPLPPERHFAVTKAPIQAYLRVADDESFLQDLNRESVHRILCRYNDGHLDIEVGDQAVAVYPTSEGGVYRYTDEDYNFVPLQDTEIVDEPRFQQGESGDSYRNVDTRLESGGPSLHTSFQAHVTLAPLTSGQTGSDGVRRIYLADEVFVSAIEIGNNDRPDTRYGSKQERHTVAWTLERAAQIALGGRQLSLVIRNYVEELHNILKSDSSGSDDEEESGESDEVEILVGYVTKLDRDLTETGSNPTRLSLDAWQQILSRIIIIYTQAYQASAAATFKYGQAKGRGEPQAMAALSAAEEAAEAGEAIDVAKVAANAAKLLDVMFVKSMNNESIARAVLHWMKNLTQAFPALMHAHEKDIVKPVLDRAMPKTVREEYGASTMGEFVTKMLGNDVAKDPLNQKFQAGASLLSGGVPDDIQIEFPASLDSDFVANVDVTPAATGQEGSLDVQVEGNAADKVSIDLYVAKQLEVNGIAISDRDRPATRFKTQMSHTVAWTLIRSAIQGLVGKSAEEFIGVLGAHFVSFAEDRANADAAALARRTLEVLHQMNQSAYPIHFWHSLLSRVVRAYVIIYQKLTAATFVDERSLARALGHGESSHMDRLHANEENLINHNALRDKESEVINSALALLDGHVNKTLGVEHYVDSILHWHEMLTLSFPTLMKVGGKAILTALLATADAVEADAIMAKQSGSGGGDLARLISDGQSQESAMSAMFSRLSALHGGSQPVKDQLGALGYTLVDVSGAGNDCALRAIHDQLTQVLGAQAGNLGDFIHAIRQSANLPMGTMIDLLNQGPQVLAAVQAWIGQQAEIDVGLAIDIWSAIGGGGLMQFDDVAQVDPQGPDGGGTLRLTIFFNGFNHFGSLRH